MPTKKKTAKKKSLVVSGGSLLVPEKIAPLVHLLRHEKVILDIDLAELYGVTTGRLNEAVQRNLDRFPFDFMFQLTDYELEKLKSQIPVPEKDAAAAAPSPTSSPSRVSPCCPAFCAPRAPWR